MECLRNQIQITKQKIEAGGGSIDFNLRRDFMFGYFNKMATRFAFGDSEEYLTVPELGNKSFYMAVSMNQANLAACLAPINVLTNGLYVNLGLSKQYNLYLANRQKSREYVYKLIDQRIQSIEKGEYTPKKTNVVDFLILESGELRKANKKPYTSEEICLHILDVYSAGINTIMGLFDTYFCRIVMKENRESLDKLNRIVKEEFAGEDYSIDQLLDHPYLHAIFSESSRVFPGLNRSFSKNVIKPFKLCGVKIRKGDDIAIRYLSLNHNKEHFPNPDKFDPSRFLDSKKPPRFTFMQFGHGARDCVGRTFGDFMVKTFLVELFKEFDFDYPEGFKAKWRHHDIFSGMANGKMIIKVANK